MFDSAAVESKETSQLWESESASALPPPGCSSHSPRREPSRCAGPLAILYENKILYSSPMLGRLLPAASRRSMLGSCTTYGMTEKLKLRTAGVGCAGTLELHVADFAKPNFWRIVGAMGKPTMFSFNDIYAPVIPPVQMAGWRIVENRPLPNPKNINTQRIAGRIIRASAVLMLDWT